MDDHSRLWLASGKSAYRGLLTQVQINETLKKEIAQVLEQRFGLSADEQAACFDQYVEVPFG